MEAQEAIDLSYSQGGLAVWLKYEQHSFDYLLDLCEDFAIEPRAEQKDTVWSFCGPDKEWLIKVPVPDDISFDPSEDAKEYHP